MQNLQQIVLSKSRWVILNWVEIVKLVQVLLQQLELYLIATHGYFIIVWIQKFQKVCLSNTRFCYDLNNTNKIKSTFIKAYDHAIKNMPCKMEAI